MSASRHTAARSGGAAVGDRHGGVDALAGQQQRERQADQRRAPDDDRPPAGDLARRSARAGASRRAACTPTRPGSPRTSRPIDRSVSPSTSFSGGIRPSTASGSRPSGSGSWTRMPCTSGSAASSATAASTWPCDAVAGRSTWRELHARPRPPCAACCGRSAGSAGRRRRARSPGTPAASRRPRSRSRRPATISSRSALPSITIAVTGHDVGMRRASAIDPVACPP